MKWDYEGKFLDPIPANYRGAVGNKFCDVIRGGLSSPTSIVTAVKREYQAHSTNGTAKAVLASGALDSPLALEFAAFLAHRESLPWEEKQKLKEQRDVKPFIREHMKGQPPTDKQLAYLRSLGCKETPQSKAEASELIDRYVNGDTSEQKSKANGSRA